MASTNTLFTDKTTPGDAAASSGWKFPAISKAGFKLPRFLRTNQAGTNLQLHKTAALKQTDRRLFVSAAAFGLTTSGLLLHATALGFASIPLTLYAFIPVFKRTADTLRKEKKINDQVLIATRVVASISVGYTFIASIDALLQSTTQRTFAYRQAAFRQTLPELTSNRPVTIPAQIEAQLMQHHANQFQQQSEQHGQQIAPWMLASFVVTTPLIGIGHGAAFLTTTFGANMRYLSPYTTQHFVLEALRRNVLILQPDALSRLARVSTLVIDAELLKTAAWQAQADTILHGLKQRNICMVSSDLLPAVLDADTACYIGRHTNPAPESALGIACCGTHEIDLPLDSSILLLGDGLSHLLSLFKLADTYVASQKFNQTTPDWLDVADIGTTILLRFGLLYSLAFTYSGLLVSTAYSDYALEKYRRTEKNVDWAP